MEGQGVTLFEIRNGAAWITLNRPDRRNALSAGLVTELYDHLVAANENNLIRAIVITGAGKAFCAGADLKNPPGSSVSDRNASMPDILNAMMDSPKPVIVAVNGSAFAGGLGIVGAADIVVTSEEAEFSFSEVRIGVIPAIISVVCVPKLGTHNAMRLFLTGDRFTGAEAVSMGLAHKAVPPDELEAAVYDQVRMITLGGPQAVRECKKLVKRVSEITRQEGFIETEEWSRRMFVSAEAGEGMTAFREKRNPAWVSGNNPGGVS